MEVFRVPQREIPVTVRLIDGSSHEGRLFAPAAGPDGAPGRLIDRLNDDDEHFIPLAAPGGGFLISKSALVAIHLGPEDGRLEKHEGGQAEEVEVAVVLEGGVELKGRVSYSLPPEKRRILDFFNATLGYVPIEQGDGMVLFNRDHVIRVRDLNGS
jgi:hypothetical protein